MDVDRLAVEEPVITSIDPWGDKRPNYRTETGGDWYKLMLSASLGCKSIHGANTTPSMEVLSKARIYEPNNAGIGMLKWDDSGELIPEIGTDISDKFYKHKPYLGTITTNSSIIAYETGMWEPSMRKRSRSASLLAAGMYAHGCQKTDAIEVASILAGDAVDPEAVESAIIPASHLKREMVITTKATQRVFSRGTIQCGILWDDSRMGLQGNLINMAFDWGRVTALARYIGEVNVQNCEKFRDAARRYGVPYNLVRNAWAYVDEADYQLHPSMFANVPKLDIEKYGIPTMLGAYTEHEQDILLCLKDRDVDLSKNVESDAFRSYKILYDAAKSRRDRRINRGFDERRGYQEVIYAGTAFDDFEIADRLEVPGLINTALLKALNTRLKHDRRLSGLYLELCKVRADIDDTYRVIEEMAPNLLNKDTWVLARVIAEDTLKDKYDLSDPQQAVQLSSQVRMIISQLTLKKAQIFRYHSHLDASAHLPASVLAEAREDILKLVDACGSYEPVTSISQRDLVSYDLRESAEVLVKLANTRADLLSEVRETVAKWFHEKFLDSQTYKYDAVKKEGTKFEYVAVALEYLEPRTCSSRNSGYIDGAAPLRSYVARCTSRLGRYFEFVPPQLERPLYSSAKQMAEELDLTGVIPFSVVAGVNFAVKILDTVVSELMLGKIYNPPESIYEDFKKETIPPSSPQYDTNEVDMQQQYSFLEEMMREVDQAAGEKKVSDYDACLNTYPSLTLANQYARYNDFQDFRDAYATLGHGAMYIPDSAYCNTAYLRKWSEEVAASAPADGEASDDDDYDPMI